MLVPVNTRLEYRVVKGDETSIEIKVNELLRNGWSLYGHMQTGGHHGTMIYQAMTRPIATKEEDGAE